LTFGEKCITFDIRYGGSIKMLSIRLDSEIEKNLETVASAMNVTKAALLREAITDYLEDRTDYLEACKVLKEESNSELTEFKAADYE
jgi:predicted DNA-binding protein